MPPDFAEAPGRPDLPPWLLLNSSSVMRPDLLAAPFFTTALVEVFGLAEEVAGCSACSRSRRILSTLSLGILIRARPWLVPVSAPWATPGALPISPGRLPGMPARSMSSGSAGSTFSPSCRAAYQEKPMTAPSRPRCTTTEPIQPLPSAAMLSASRCRAPPSSGPWPWRGRARR